MRVSLSIILIIISSVLFAQRDCNNYPEQYIPVDLSDAICYLDCILKDSVKNNSDITLEDFAFYYFERNRTVNTDLWGLLRGDSELYNYCQSLGLTHPDDMYNLIFSSYRRHLNNKDLEIEKNVKLLVNWRNHREISERKIKDTHFTKFNVNDTVYFKYKFGFTSRDQKQSFFKDSCDVIGIVTEINSVKLELKVKLLESCDTSGIIINIEDIYEKKGLEVILIEKSKRFYMKEGDEKWTFYDLWQKND